MDKEMDWDSALERHEARVNGEMKKQNQADNAIHHENPEPIGEVVFDDMGIGNAQVVRLQMFKRIPPVGTKLYAAPVRTKDLTDDEIVKVTGCEKDRPLWLTVSSIARAVIAADRAKNSLCDSANAEEKNK